MLDLPFNPANGFEHGEASTAKMAMFFDRKNTINHDAITIPADPIVDAYCTLTRTISALLLQKDETGTAQLGPLRQLQPGTRVGICGCGINERTVKVRTDAGQFYFVFAEDLVGPTT